jgi:RHS repeat-associated protein
VQTVVDPRGIVSVMVYDALGRTTISIANFLGGLPGPEYDVMTFDTFGAAGRLTTRTADPINGLPPQVTGFVYGVSPATGSLITSNDILAETRYPDPSTGGPSTTDRDVYTVNALGDRLTYTDRAGTTHTYTYDVVGRRISDTVTTLGTGVNGAVRRIETTHDALGNATSVTSFNAATGGSAVNQVVRAFTSFGQLTSEWQSHTGLVNLTTTPRVQYAYLQSTAGTQTRLSQMTYPDGYTLSLNSTGYDLVAGRVTNISGAQAGSGTSGVLEAFKYLGASTAAERSRPEVGIMLTMATTTGITGDGGDKYTGLDRFGRVVDQRWITGSGSSAGDVDRHGYTYDEHGNRTGRSNALAAAFSETYGYEGLNQLQSFTRGDAESPSLTQGWQFDALGNWTTFTTNGTDQTRVFNAQNELLQVGSTALTYSATGNMTTDAQGRTLVYDAWNRLVSVSNSSGTQIAAYQYDGMSRRIVEQVAATGTSLAAVRDMFYSQAWQVLEERVRTASGDIPATADTRYVWSPVYVDALVARDRNADANTSTGTGGLEERVYALQDANWNTTATVAASGVAGFSAGATINRFAYTPYGESQTLTASWGTPAAGSSPATPWQHLFQGLKFSDVTGLAYVRARDYSATLGRFIELDPIGFDAGDNNWYRFVGNGPTGNVDPSGLVPWHEKWSPDLTKKERDRIFAVKLAELEKQLKACCNALTKPKAASCQNRSADSCNQEVRKIVAGLQIAYDRIYVRGSPAYFDFWGPVCTQCQEEVAQQIGCHPASSAFDYSGVAHIGPAYPFTNTSVHGTDHQWGEITHKATGKVFTIDFWVGGTEFWLEGADAFGWKRTPQQPSATTPIPKR